MLLMALIHGMPRHDPTLPCLANGMRDMRWPDAGRGKGDSWRTALPFTTVRSARVSRRRSADR
jgi:hypothetical protein